MKEHHYFGNVHKKEFWSGFHSGKTFKVPYFEKEIYVYLGSEYDDEDEEIETPPTDEQLAEFEQTFKSFLDNIDSIIIDIKQSAFDYYQKYYAKYYEKDFDVLFANDKVQPPKEGKHPPLGISQKEQHFEYMNDILEAIRILKNHTIIIPFCYTLDQEHGLEIKLVDNKVAEIGGIGETSYPE